MAMALSDYAQQQFLGHLRDGRKVYKFSNPILVDAYYAEQDARADAHLDAPPDPYTDVPPPTEPPPTGIDNRRRRGKPKPPPDAAAQDQPDTTEALIAHRLDWLRINREAKRRLDDEEHPPILPPPIKPLTTLLAEPDTPVTFRIDQVAPLQSRIIVSAQAKDGKTSIVNNLMRSLVDGDPFLGHFPVNTPARIVLIDDELSENMLRRWLRDQDIHNTDAVVDVVSLRGRIGSFNLLDDRCRRRWSQRFAELGASYLILDCLRPVLDALGLDESRDTGRFLVQFDAMLADSAITDALLAHHMGHGNHERARGDSRLEDWPDVIWRIVHQDTDTGPVRYFKAVGRDVYVPEGRLAFNADTRQLTYTPGSRGDAKTEDAYRALIVLLADSDEALSGRAITEALTGEHSRQASRDALGLAVSRGVVIVEKGPRRSKLHRIAHPCSECGLPVSGGVPRHFSCPSEPEGAPGE
jgi:hypothetical protein